MSLSPDPDRPDQPDQPDQPGRPGTGDPIPDPDFDLEDAYTVVGVWPETKERYQEWVTAASPRQAEDLARMTAKEAGGVLWVCAVFSGKLTALDLYATFADDPDRTTQANW